MYIGEKVNDLRHGKGKLFYVNGGVYDGEWLEGKMDGFGTLFFPSGAIAYQGEFREDKFEGQGVLNNEQPMKMTGEFNYHNFEDLEDQWTRYEGSFSNDTKEGRGVLYLSNGEKFEGCFKNDVVHGEGVFSALSGQAIAGTWENNRLVKIWRITKDY
eukprot:TRINITY_DN24394_c0_g1_i1.p1 TRINITY_DN24394_c0_g1~~TRINITY_DN24394_c0_g1_i1.p1  ORF type:complete len:157 (+),score=43.88 TRINITY_DN24394_c0_g1_i1:284-754(+)